MTFPFFIKLRYPDIIAKAAFFISTISYSLYLVHQLVIHFFIQEFFDLNTKGNAFIAYLIFWGSSIAASYLLYKLLEVRIMNWRDKLVRD